MMGVERAGGGGRGGVDSGRWRKYGWAQTVGQGVHRAQLVSGRAGPPKKVEGGVQMLWEVFWEVFRSRHGCI